MDAIVARVRAASGLTLPAGALGAERGIRPGADLEEAALPHLFIYMPHSVETELDFQQSEIVTTYALELWVKESQEQICTYRDAIRDSFEAQPTLSGIVEHVRVASSGILEDSADADARRVLTLEVETLIYTG
jgi:hypothetical protein